MKRAIILPAFVLAAGLAALAGCVTADGGDGAALSGDMLSLDEAIAISAADITAKLPPGTRVAIAAFESPHPNLSAYIMDEVAGALAGGSLEVADRNNLEYMYKELDFQMSGDVSDETAQAIGKFLGAKYVITGQLIDLGGRCRYRLNGINVETAGHESSTRLDVRNDRAFRKMSAALQKASPAARTAGYGTGGAPKTAGTFLDRGIMFAGRREWDLAIEDFSEALTLNPDLAAAWMLRGRALFASVSRITNIHENFSGVGSLSTGGKVSDAKKAVYDKAIADFSQAIRLDPDNKNAWRERGRGYADKGDYDKAIADCNQAIRLDPEGALAYNSRGLAYYHKKDYDRAIADYNQAIRLDPEDAAAYSNRGLAYIDKKDYDRAIADCSQAIRLDPEYAVAYSNRGIAYRNKGDTGKAIADYSQAIRLDPEYAAAYNNRGWTYYHKKDYDRAIADCSQAIRLDPEGALAYNNRGVAYKDKGDYVRARADYEQALRIDPDLSYARENLEWLRGMGY